MQNSSITKKKYKKRQTTQQQQSQTSISSFNSSMNFSHLTQRRSSTNAVEVHDLSTYIAQERPLKEFKFQYNFNQYLRLFLIKVLPPKNHQIIIKPKEKTLKGPQNQAEELLRKIKQEFQIFAMKVIKFNANADIEQVQFHLEKKYDLKIYNKKFLKLTVQDVIKSYHLVEQSLVFLKRIQSQQLILIRVQKKVQSDCIQDINNLIHQSAQVQQGKIVNPRIQMSKANPVTSRIKNVIIPQPQSSSQSSSEQQIVEDQNQPTYYQHRVIRQVKPVRSQYNNRISNKMEEPTQEDSVSAVQAKRRRYREKKEDSGSDGLEPIKKQQKQKPIYQKEYDQNSFDIKNFEGWLKNIKNLSKNVKIIKEKDPYSEGEIQHTYKIQLFSDPNSTKNELIQSLEVYLKFRKVIMLKLKNEKYREDLYRKYEKDDQSLVFKFIKGHKSPKWPESQMWKHIIKKDYSLQKKSANTQYFELFFLQGLKNVVLQTQKQVRKQVQNERSQDQNQQIMIKLDQISDHLRNNQKLKDMIKKYIQKMIDNFKHCCKFVNVDFPLAFIKVLVHVKYQQKDQFQKNIKNQIIQKAKKQIIISEHKCDYPINKAIYDKLQKNIIIIKKHDKGFTYVGSIFDAGNIITEITAILSAFNNIVQKQLKIQDKMVVKKIQQRLAQIKAEKQYGEVNWNYNENSFKFKLYGKQYLLDAVLKRLEEYKKEIQEKKINYIQIVKKKQAELLQYGKFLKEIYEKYQILINVNKKQLDCKIVLTKNSQSFRKKNIMVIKSKSLDYAPYGSVIAFKNINQIDLFKNYFIKTFRNYINKHKQQIFHQNTRKYTFIIKNKDTGQILKDALAVNPNASNHIIMIMPQKGKEAFVKSIIKVLLQEKQYADRDLTVMIIQYGQAADIQKEINISPYVKGKKLKLKDQTITKYYVEDSGKKFYYSESGNRKILTAKQKGFNQIILNNEDLNITHESHQFYPQTLQIVHLQSTKSFPVKITNTKVEFTLKNQVYQIPPIQSTRMLDSIIKNSANTLRISLGVYEIDLAKTKQINLFSDFQRKLCKEQTIIKADINQDQIQAFYNYKTSQLEYSYYFDESIMANFTNSRTDVVNFLTKSIKQKQIQYTQYKNIQISDLQGIKSTIQEDEQTQFLYDHTTKTITIKTLDDTTLNRCQQMIRLLLNNINQRDPNKIKYPNQWETQKEDIEIFQVKQNSKEFQNVQDRFTVGKIKQLHRIQNKIIYKKYFEESIFLQSLNGTKIKTTQLFHGTRTTNPQQIYKDKQQSFNINYSSDNNLLGKGIYFAQKSQYSNSYRYTQVSNTGKIFGFGATNIHSMFLCEVLVGTSEKCMQHNGAIKDTNYKDVNKKIRYQSMTDYLVNSNIYVVYKSRRAYPLYLIKY